jgi:phosphate transport system substrate-binding protein
MDHRIQPFRSFSGPSERRRCTRYSLETSKICFDAGAGESHGVVLNFCEGGMAVRAEAHVEPGSIQHLRWELPQQAEPLETEGTVVWVDKEKQLFGIKFRTVSEPVRQSLSRWAKRQAFDTPTPVLPDSQLLEEILRDMDYAIPSSALFNPQRVKPSREVAQLSPRETAFHSSGMDSSESTSELPLAGRLWSPVAASVAVMALVVLGIGAYWGGRAARVADPGVASGTGSVQTLRLAGSNTIGAKLAPALAQAFLKQLGAKDIRLLPGAKEDEQVVQGVLSSFLQGSNRVEIQIGAHGSTTAFENLINASCDIGMSSRKIKPKEIEKLSSLGDMSSPASEHLLGLDGIAVIVSSSNPVEMLTKDQLAGIFSGTIVDWSEVSGRHGTINVYAPDNRSGTFDTFKTLVLANKRLSGTARRLEDSQALSEAVAGDHNGIGFIGLPFVLSAKSIAVAERGATAFQPNRLTVGTEDYLLSRRLYLYTPANSPNDLVRKFVEFALSKSGQEVVGDVGFVAQNVTSEKEVISPSAPSEYRRLTLGAGRLSLDFRFLPGLTVLDSKALADLDRVVSFLADSKFSGNDLLLFGFTDNTGDRDANIAISQIRARIVAKEFAQRGLRPTTVKGFGPDLPVGSNDSDVGRERNRRVEIWLRQAQCAAPRPGVSPLASAGDPSDRGGALP